jgi:DNA uptake protein ComE-like DNA-binding protein
MLEKLRQLVRNYFGFSRSQTNGFIILVPLMVFILFSPGIYVSLFSQEYDPYEEDIRIIDSLISVWNEGVVVKKAGFERASPPVIKLRSFDPNKITIEDMGTLGIPGFLARRIDNYRQKGGQFRVKKDLSSIYDFPDSLYQQLESYIALPEKLDKTRKISVNARVNKPDTTHATPYVKKTEERPRLWININSADTMELRKLRGIGPAFSRRIVKYRSLLGGFVDKEQLMEVYGLSDSLYHTLSDQVYVERLDSMRLINVNIASYETLKAHPYISYKVARDILNTRSKRGKFRSPADLLVVQGLDSAQVSRLSAYVTF